MNAAAKQVGVDRPQHLGDLKVLASADDVLGALGFDAVGDAVFRDLVIARVVSTGVMRRRGRVRPAVANWAGAPVGGAM